MKKRLNIKKILKFIFNNMDFYYCVINIKFIVIQLNMYELHKIFLHFDNK